ncbi:MAG: type II secretion system F family protein [Actinomycetota bacterium]|nr:type II secretion system F family protein [Actinomycetota bacterium]
MTPSPLHGALLGAGIGIGVLLTVAAWFGQIPSLSKMRTRLPQVDRLAARAGLAFAAGVGGWWWTGWIAAGVAGAAVGWSALSLIGLRDRRRRAMAQTEAVAVWAEMLRDLLVSNAGMREAISRSARVAPEPIAAEVKALEVRARRGQLSGALQRFADELANPVADTVVLAIMLAETRAVSDLGGMLADVAGSTRETVAMQRRINAARARVYRTSQLIAGVVGFFIGLLLVTNREYMEPFGTVVGQLVLVGVLGLVAGSVWSMMRLSRPVQAARLLRVGGRSAP